MYLKTTTELATFIKTYAIDLRPNSLTCVGNIVAFIRDNKISAQEVEVCMSLDKLTVHERVNGKDHTYTINEYKMFLQTY